MSTLHTELNPKTVQALRRFGTRRKVLQFLRGVCETGVIALLAINFIAFMDYAMVLGDTSRFLLAMGAYGCIILAFYFLLIRPLKQLPDLKELARLFEKQFGMHTEDVLSAVEFGEDMDGADLDSPEFRAILQNQVAQGVSGVKPSKLLPWKMISRWAIALAVFVLLVLIFFSIEQFQYPTRLLRALMPHRNIARVSAMQVTILDPNLRKPVPLGEPMPLVISLSDPTNEVVYVESYTSEEQRPERLSLRKEEDRIYSADLNVPGESLTFRILAADAVTQWYTIYSHRRPHVTGFEKTYHYPEYTRMEPKTFSEESGDLAALSGTRARLVMTTDQPVQKASLSLELDENQLDIALEVLENGKVSGFVDMVKPGTYRVNLLSEVAPDTFFENKYSPSYEITIEPDLKPEVELVAPMKNMVVLPNQLINVYGTAKDDYGLDRVTQLVRVNTGAWESTVLKNAIGDLTAEIGNDWNLATMDLRGGDLIYLRLAAMDNRGSLGESKVIRLKVMSFETVQEEQQQLDEMEQTQEKLENLAEELEKLQEMAKEMQEKFQEDDPQAEEQLQQTQEMTEQVQEMAEELAKELQQQANNTDDPQTRQDMQMMAELAQQIAQQPLQQAQEQMEEAQQEDQPQESVDEAKEQIDEAQEMAEQLANAHQQMMDQQQTQLTAEQLEMLAQMQQQQMDQAEETQDFEQMAQQEQPLMEMQQALEAQLPEELAQPLEQARQEMQQAMEEPGEQMMEQAQQLQQALEMAQQQMQEQQQQEQQQMMMMRQEMAHMIGEPPPPNENQEDAFDEETPDNSNLLPQVVMDDSDWNTLRSREAENVMQSSRESVGEDYRNMVGAYFEALSNIAKEE